MRSDSPSLAGASSAATVGVLAPAKINLALHICGRRTDGYHLLDSLVVFAGTGDRITARSAEQLNLTVDGPYGDALRGESDNLVLRACRFLAERLKRPAALDVRLEKILPVAAGVGGGSSDAAATLLAAARVWNADLHHIAPVDLAAALGADVPVCLARKPARMTGVGEIVTPTPTLPEAWIVLVNPRQPLATKAVYGALAGRHSGSLPILPSAFATAHELAGYLSRCRNDLGVPAAELMPAIADVLHAIERVPDCLLARVSGSGPTCFGLFATADAASRAAERIESAHRGWWVAAAPMLKASDPLLAVEVG